MKNYSKALEAQLSSHGSTVNDLCQYYELDPEDTRTFSHLYCNVGWECFPVNTEQVALSA